MSLKSLIQWLLDSRTTPSEASHSSYPDDGTVTQFSPSATSVSSWTKVVDSTIAPSDGYVIVRGKATGESFVQITAGDNPPHMERSTFAKATLNQYPILNLPIAKGKTFKVFAENTAEITVGLIKSIGGGYNNLVRRALSCLKPSFNYLPKVFLRAKNSGLAAKPSLIQELNSVTQQEGMSLQRTDTSVSSIQAAQEAVCFLTSTQERIQMCHRQIVVSETVGCLLRTLTWGLLSLLKKECQSILRRIQSQNRFGSVQRQGGVNFRTGGALC